MDKWRKNSIEVAVQTIRFSVDGSVKGKLLAGGLEGERLVRLPDQTGLEKLNRAMVRFTNNPEWSDAYVGVYLPQKFAGIRRAAKLAFGKDIIAITSSGPIGGDISGISIDRHIYINVRSNKGFVQILGHELLHQLKKQARSSRVFCSSCPTTLQKFATTKRCKKNKGPFQRSAPHSPRTQLSCLRPRLWQALRCYAPGFDSPC